MSNALVVIPTYNEIENIELHFTKEIIDYLQNNPYFKLDVRNAGKTPTDQGLFDHLVGIGALALRRRRLHEFRVVQQLMVQSSFPYLHERRSALGFRVQEH